MQVTISSWRDIPKDFFVRDIRSEGIGTDIESRQEWLAIDSYIKALRFVVRR
jgi:hypothetical protein